MMSSRYVLAFAAVLAAGGCMVGPDYKRPPPADPPSLAFKETTGPVVGAAASFQPAMPRDAIDRGPWWSMYDDHDARPAGGADRHLQPDADAGRGGLSPGARAGSPGCVGPLSHGHGQRRLHPERQRLRFEPRYPGHRGQRELGQRRPVQRRPAVSTGRSTCGAASAARSRAIRRRPRPAPPTSPMRGCRRRPTWRSTTSPCASPSSACGSTRRRWRPTRARSRSCRTSSMPAS